MESWGRLDQSLNGSKWSSATRNTFFVLSETQQHVMPEGHCFAKISEVECDVGKPF